MLYIFCFIHTNINIDVRRKLPDRLLKLLLSDLYTYFDALQCSDLQDETANELDFILKTGGSLSNDPDAADSGPQGPSTASTPVSEWFVTFLEYVWSVVTA